MLKRLLQRFPAGMVLATIISTLNSAGFSLSLPFLSLYLYQQRDVPMTLVGLFILCSGLVAAATQMYTGLLSDKFGRRPLILWSMAGSTALYVLMAVLVSREAPIWSIISTYILVRCSLMAARPAISALVVDLMPKARLSEGYGLLRMGQNFGFGFGPVIGGYFWLATSYSWLFAVAALISAAAFGVAFLFLKESSNNFIAERISFSAVMMTARDKAFFSFTLISIFAFMGLGQFISTLSVYTVDRIGFTPVQFGSLLTLNAILVVVLQYPVTRRVNKIARSTALLLGMLVYALGYFVLGFVGPYSMALLAMGLITFGEILFSPVSMTVVAELSPPSWRGRYQGFYGLAETLGISLGPTVGGVLLDITAPAGQMALWAPIAGVIMIAGFAFYIWGRRNYRYAAQT